MAGVAVYTRCALRPTPAVLFIRDVCIIELQEDRPLVAAMHLSPNVCQARAIKFVLHAFPTHPFKKLAMTGDLNIDGSKTSSFSGRTIREPASGSKRVCKYAHYYEEYPH